MTYTTTNGAIINLNIKDKFASGGEGAVYMHPKDKSKCIKIYHTPKPKSLVPTFVELNKLDSKWFIKPEELLFTTRGELAGFEMKYVDLSKYFILKKLATKTFCDQNGYDRAFKFKVCESMKKAVEDAHSRNIVIGDLNPYNVFVNDSGDVIFVDVDSYATKDKPHSGVLLEDIRDFYLHPNINQKTDAFAFDVLVFWLFTYVHPYRGNTKLYKNLEERVVRKASILANIPDLIIPAVYEKFTNKHILDQFFEVFQNGARFFVNLAGIGTIPQNVPAFQPLNLNSKDLYIRLMEDDIVDAFASNNLICLKLKNGTYKIYNVSNYSQYNMLENFSADDVFLGNKNYVYRKGDNLFHSNVLIKNFQFPQNYKFSKMNNTLFVIDNLTNVATKIAIDNITNGQIQKISSEMFAPSVQIQDSILQFVGDSNWFFIPDGTNHNTVRTNLNLKNAYYCNGVFCIEYIENNVVKYGLFKVNGNKLENIYNLSDFCYFDVKGDYIYVPQDNKIELVSILRKEVVMTIDCPVCKNDSKIFQTGGGMIIFTNNKVFFINKK